MSAYTINGLVGDSERYICHGEANPSISVTPDYYESNYKFDWKVDGNNYGDKLDNLQKYIGKEVELVVKDRSGIITETKKITIKQESEIKVQPQQPSQPFCKGESIEISATSVDGASFSWAIKDEQVNGNAKPFSATGETVSISKGGTYVVTATRNGCSNSAQMTIQEPAGITLSGNDGLCAGKSLDIKADGMDSYRWSDGTTGNTAKITAAGDGYWVAGESGGCKDTATFEVNEKEQIFIDLRGVIALCPGETSTTLTAFATDGNSTITYEWTDPDFKTIGNDPTVTIEREGEYTINVVSSSGCTGQRDFTVSTVNNIGEITITGKTEICQGSSTVLTPNGTNLTDFFTGEEGFLEEIPKQGLTITSGGTYTIEGKTKEGCPSKPYTFEVKENENPQLNIENLYPCEGDGDLILKAFYNEKDADLVFSWDDADKTTETEITVSATGQYSATLAHKGTRCRTKSSAHVEYLAYPKITIAGEPTFCSGGSTTLKATASGTKIKRRSYKWLNEKGDAIVEGDSVIVIDKPGTYTFVARNEHDCETEEKVTVTEKESPTVTISQSAQYLCDGETVTFTAKGSKAKSYSWLNNNKQIGDGEELQVRSAGSYTLVVTGNNGCTANSTASIGSKSKITIETKVDTICEGGVGYITVTASDGNATFSWEDSQNTTNKQEFTQSGTHTVNVTDTDGCSQKISFPVKVHENPTPAFMEKEISFCLGETTSIFMNVSSYYNKFKWERQTDEGTTDLKQNDSRITIKESGKYTFTETSSFGCSGSVSTEVVIHELPAVTLDAPDTICGSGRVTITASGADTYRWGGRSARYKPFTAENTYTEVLSPGRHTIIVEGLDTKTNCESKPVEKVITVDKPIVLTIEGATSICDGETSTISVRGATNYVWKKEGKTENTSDTYTIKEEGEFSIEASDPGSACKADTSFIVQKEELPVVSVSDTFICEGGADISINASGANSYEWKETSATETNSGESVTIGQPGSYQIIGYSTSNCASKPKVFNVSLQKLNASITGDDILCIDSSAVLRATAAGKGPFQFSWDEEGFSAIDTFRIEMEGMHSLTVKDSSGCLARATKMFVFTQPEIGIDGPSEFCADSTITLSAKGNAEHYYWNGATTESTSLRVDKEGVQTLTAVDKFGCKSQMQHRVAMRDVPTISIADTVLFCENGSSPAEAALNRTATFYKWNNGEALSSQNTFEVSQSGEYTVMGYDDLMCPSATATFFAKEVKLPTITITGQNYVCEDGDAITLTATTDMGRDYKWSNGGEEKSITVTKGGTYSVTTHIGTCVSEPASFTVEQKQKPAVSIAEGTSVSFCDLDSMTLHAVSPTAKEFGWFLQPSTTDTLSQNDTLLINGEGDFSVVVSDEFGCKNQTTTEVKTVKGPNVTIIGDTVVCQYNKTSIEAVCPTCDSLVWNTGDKSTVIEVEETGAYQVVGFNSSGCPSKTAEHKLTMRPAPKLTVKGKTDITSNDTTVLTADVDGDGPFVYHWTPGGESSPSITVRGDELSPNKANLFTVQAFDKNGCYNFALTKVTLHSVSIQGKTDICRGDSSELSVNAIGAEKFLWNTGDTTAAVKVTLDGTYTVITSFSNGLVDTVSIDVNVHEAPTVEIIGNHALCTGDSIVLGRKGTDIAKTFWNTGSRDSSIIARDAGQYRVDVESTYGCRASDSLAVIVNPLPPVTILGSDSILEGSSTVWEATGAMAFRWNDPDTLTSKLTVSNKGRYTVQGTDANGCKNSAYKDLHIIPVPHPLINDTADAVIYACEGDTLTLIASGAETYTWDTGETTDAIRATESRVYTVTGCLKNGQCRDVSISAQFSPHPRMMNIVGDTKFCPDSSGVITAHTYDDTLIEHFVWNTGEQTQSIKVSKTGAYSAYAVSLLGCISDTMPVEIQHHPTPLVNFAGLNEICSGSFTQITAHGGVRYEWLNENVHTDLLVATAGGEHRVRVWNEHGCSTDSSIFIRELGKPSISITGNRFFCENESTTLTAQGRPFSENHITWNTTAHSDSILVNKEGTYIATVSNNAGCVASDTVVVAVNRNPVITIDGPTQFCIGDTITLTSKLLSGESLKDLVWNTGSHAHSIRFHESGVFTLQAMDVNGCLSNTAQKKVQVLIPTPLTVNGDFDLCVDREDKAVVTAESQEALTYIWLDKTLTDTLQTSTTNSYTFSAPGVYRVESVDANYCKSKAEIVIRGRKNPHVEILGAEIPVCGKEVATLTASTDADVDFVWGNGGKTSLLTADSSGTFSLFGINSYGCYASDTVDLILNDIPGMATDEKYQFCPGESTNITVSGASTYIWSNGSTGSSAAFSEPAQGFVVGTDRYGCQKRINFNITEHHVPSVLLVASPTEILRTEPTVSFEATSPEPLDDCRFHWVLGDGEEETLRQFKHEYSITNQRTFHAGLVVTTPDECKVSQQVTIKCDLDIPNTITPNGDGINDIFMQGCHVWIYDRHGVLLHEGVDGWDGTLPNGHITADTYYYVLLDVTGERFYGYVTIK